MNKILTIIVSIAMISSSCAQQNMIADKTQEPDLPYFEIPAYPENFSAANVLARTIDGLGYRYYWATEGLTADDLQYKPSEDGRSAGETLDHLYGLSSFISNAIFDKPNVRPSPEGPTTWEATRNETLWNIKRASDLLKTKEGVSDLKITFQRGDQTSEMSFWHVLNGPLADAIYHVGQIVVFRRAAGNPMHPGVSVFMGKTTIE